MSLETSVSQNMNVINDKLTSYDVIPSNFFINYEHFRERDSFHRLNNNNNNNIINLPPLDIDFQNTQLFTVPINIPPPPPHKIVIRNNTNNATILKKYEDEGKKSTTSPERRYESDESAKSSTPHSTQRSIPRNNNKMTKTNSKNNRKNRKTEQISTDKFNHHSPNNVYQPHYYDQNDSNVSIRSTRYYTHFSIRSRQNARRNNPMDIITRRVHGLMERFKSRSHLLRVDPNPEKLLTGGASDHLNQAIWDVFISKAQKENTYISKLETWKSIFLTIKDCLISYGLFIVGSTMSGFGLDTSDIDMCLLTKPITCDPKQDAIFHLNQVKDLLLKNGLVVEAELIEAKVPILKFKDLITCFEIDLNCNNGIGIQNTHLLQCYARLDWRVRAMVVIVKVWAQTNNINDAKNMTISSYSLALMVINYLQCGVTPPVLPCLHGIHPELFNSTAESYTDVQEDYEIEFSSDNENCLGDLLIGFLNYYSHFNFADFAISVRTGSRLPINECRYLKAPKNDVNQWKFLCIEEPFNYSNTARSVFDVDKFKFIKDVFMYSYWELSRTKNLNMILPVHVPVVSQR